MNNLLIYCITNEKSKLLEKLPYELVKKNLILIILIAKIK